MKTLATNISGLPAWTYGPDGEARVSSIAASSGPNPLTSTTYNGFGPTGVTFGSDDSDSFSYDPNTGRETQYKFTVNGANETGTLTWNANGTLQKLAISDPFIAANTQTCTNTYDDLARLIANNCGSVWNQSFGFDAFGNITKSGTTSFQPTYSQTTNRYSGLPVGQPLYDLNGNLQNGSFHSYDWNAEGLNTDIDSSATSMIYDALGRWVERRNAGTVAAVYGPDGRELAVMIGQSLVGAYVALPAGATALYLSSGQLGNWWHPDWLGTARLYSNPSHVIVGDSAYAPFGEVYNSAPIDSFFTGVAMNVEANDYRNFPARDLHTTEGRWLTPDPAGSAAVDLTNPQTLNRYAYVMNNPLANVDPTGMFTEPGGGSGGQPGCTWDPDTNTLNCGNTSLPGCVAYGSEGCIKPPCVTLGASCTVPVYSGTPPTNTSGGVSPTQSHQPPKTGTPQTFNACMAAHANDFSIVGTLNYLTNTAFGRSDNYKDSFLGGFVGGNSITSLLYGSLTDQAGAPFSVIAPAMGTATSYGRRTSTIMSLNLEGKGGLPLALGGPSALKSVLGSTSKVLSLGLDLTQKLAVDAGFASAEAAYCWSIQ
ncbi:MAG TPA: RHS repeat-associated core domain-containing protein [Terriglobales bacterium]|nr:RHS repeat-associated core domain-containing protein [Terriglobales bacterium]